MKKKLLFIASLLVGLIFINAGLNKFLNYMPVPDDMPADTMAMFMAMMKIGWLMPLVGAVEIVGGTLFIFPRTRALAAIILVPILTGILLTHLAVAPEGLPIPLALMGIFVWVVVENRERYMPMLR